jgi:hypothetical protein
MKKFIGCRGHGGTLKKYPGKSRSKKRDGPVPILLRRRRPGPDSVAGPEKEEAEAEC